MGATTTRGLRAGSPRRHMTRMRRPIVSVDGLTRVLAIELLTAARGLGLRAPLLPSPATGAVVAALREGVPGAGPDRFLAPEIEYAVYLLSSGRALAAVQSGVGTLS